MSPLSVDKLSYILLTGYLIPLHVLHHFPTCHQRPGDQLLLNIIIQQLLRWAGRRDHRYVWETGWGGGVTGSREEGSQVHRGEEGSQIHRGEEGSQVHRGEEGSQVHRGEEGSQVHRGEEGSQVHRGEEGP